MHSGSLRHTHTFRWESRPFCAQITHRNRPCCVILAVVADADKVAAKTVLLELITAAKLEMPEDFMETLIFHTVVKRDNPVTF